MIIELYLHIWWVQVVAGLLVGGACGYFFFTSLARSAQRIVEGSVASAILAQLLRLILLAPVLLALALYGSIALLAATAGLTLARQYVVSAVTPLTLARPNVVSSERTRA